MALFEAGGFDDPGLDGYRAGLALMHALQSGLTSTEVGMERVLAILGEDRPAGADWHRKIIDRLSRPGARGFERLPLLSEPVARDLQETRRFRNLATHSYGEFDPARATPTIEAARRPRGSSTANSNGFARAWTPPALPPAPSIDTWSPLRLNPVA